MEMRVWLRRARLEMRDSLGKVKILMASGRFLGYENVRDCGNTDTTATKKAG
jgi:hypothetical protein